MSTPLLEQRLLSLEAKYRAIRLITVLLAVVSVALCGLVGYVWGRAGGGQPLGGGLGSLAGSGPLEVSQLSIKSPSGEERIRLDPGGITIFGQRDRQEQLRLEFGGMRFFTDAGETSRFNSNELSFADGDTGLRCSLDWRYLVCEDEKSGGLSATFGILAPPKGSLTPQQTEYFKKMARTPHLSLSNLKTTSNIDLLVVPEPSIMVSSEAGKTVLSGGVRSTANGIRVPDVPSITVSDKTSRVLWKAP